MRGMPLTKMFAGIALALGLTVSLQGCVLLLVGAAAGGGALVASDRRTLGAQTEDKEIDVKARARLHDQMPADAHVSPTVYNRRVLLTGEVPNAVTRQRAESSVRDINNVTGIVNELAIAPPNSLNARANDSYLEGKVKTALIAERHISAVNFKVVAARGTVYLMGLVTRAEGNRGANAASRVTGVAKVVKVFQYIRPDDPKALEAESPLATQASTSASGNTSVGTVPDAAVTSRPLDGPAPIANSSVRPGNPHARP